MTETVTRSPKAGMRRKPAAPDVSGLWFLFFLCLYGIFLLKVTSGNYVAHSIFFGIYSITITFYILTRFFFAFSHRTPLVDMAYEPSVSFVVPAKNEEDNIAETVRRFGMVDYPREKIEVILINDGSTDDTLAGMRRAAEKLSLQVRHAEVVHFPVNKGKRYGMAEGIKRARHDIVVFVDSDSFVEPASIRHLVKYFKDPRIGAVSAHSDVFNRNTNWLTRMQGLRYYISFTIYKAAESVFGNVTCCPGCCSAYRRSYLLEVVQPWLHQTFLGKECTFGDDRSLTNYILREYYAAYAPEAKAFTVVPDTFSKYMRQQQRWKKSWVRETFIASSFIWRKNPLAAGFFYAYMFLAFTAPIVFIHAVLWVPVVFGVLPTVYFFGLLLMLLLHGIYYRIYTDTHPWVSPVISFWFTSVALMWQLPWALFTIADTRWGTR